MKSLRAVAGYRKPRRGEPVWELLAAHNGPVIAGVLKTLLSDGGRTLAASILHERVTVELESLRADGEDLPQMPESMTPRRFISPEIASARQAPRVAAGAIRAYSLARTRLLRPMGASLRTNANGPGRGHWFFAAPVQNGASASKDR